MWNRYLQKKSMLQHSKCIVVTNSFDLYWANRFSPVGTDVLIGEDIELDSCEDDDTASSSPVCLQGSRWFNSFGCCIHAVLLWYFIMFSNRRALWYGNNFSNGKNLSLSASNTHYTCKWIMKPKKQWYVFCSIFGDAFRSHAQVKVRHRRLSQAASVKDFPKQTN